MSFVDLKGQGKALGFLKTALESGRFASAYLFSGPEGVGKFLAARMLAKALNCERNDNDFCGVCSSCVRIEKNGYPDVHIVGGTVDTDSEVESEAVKIDSIRELHREISLRPYEGRKKVFIIDNAHYLTPDAQNALLKVLEEPPAQSCIILVSAKPNMLFKTILSRCRQVVFFSIARQNLENILEREYKLSGQDAHFFSYFCEGRIGAALRLKDREFIKEKNAIIDASAAAGSRGNEIFTVKSRLDMRVYLNILSTWLRDMYLLKLGLPHAELIHLDRKEQLLSSMHRYTISEIEEGLQFISDSLACLEQNVNVKLLLAQARFFMKG